MAEKIFDKEQSAAANETAINAKFQELSQGGSPASGVVLSPEAEFVDIPYQLSCGYLNGQAVNNGSGLQAVIYHYHQTSGSNDDTLITDVLTFSNMQGKYIFIPFGFVDGDNQRPYLRYTVMPTLPENITQGGAYAETAGSASSGLNINYWHKSVIIIPIAAAEVMYRFAFKKAYASTAKVYVVTKGWLQRNGYVNNWAGKKWVMYGDSYVKGQAVSPTWHRIYADMNAVSYTNKGYGGIGLLGKLNTNSTLLSNLINSELDISLMENGQPLDVDIIGVTCGRNDYSASVPIGDIEDMVTMTDPTSPTTGYGGDQTFMGALNYICKWLVENYMGKKIFFITPWYFPDDKAGTAVADPVDYVDAILAVTGKWGIPCFDAARCSGISVQDQAFRAIYFKGNDGSDISHLSVAGHALMAKGPVAKWLESLFVD